MNTPTLPPRQSNTLGAVSLVLGTIAVVGMVAVALCAGVGHEQGWLKHIGPLVLIVAGTVAFMGALSVLLGFLGLWGRNRSRAAAIAGMLLGIGTILIFLAAANAVS